MKQENKSMFRKFWLFLIIPVGISLILIIFSLFWIIDSFFNVCSYETRPWDIFSFLHLLKCPNWFWIFSEIIKMNISIISIISLWLVILWIIEIPFFINIQKKVILSSSLEKRTTKIIKIIFWFTPIIIYIFYSIVHLFIYNKYNYLIEKKNHEEFLLLDKISKEIPEKCPETFSGIYLKIEEIGSEVGVMWNWGKSQMLKRFKIAFPEGFLLWKWYIVISPKNYWNWSLDIYDMFRSNKNYITQEFSEFSKPTIEFKKDVYNYTLNNYDLRVFTITNEVENLYMNNHNKNNAKLGNREIIKSLNDLFEYQPEDKEFFIQNPIYASKIFPWNNDCITVKLEK